MRGNLLNRQDLQCLLGASLAVQVPISIVQGEAQSLVYYGNDEDSEGLDMTTEHKNVLGRRQDRSWRIYSPQPSLEDKKRSNFNQQQPCIYCKGGGECIGRILLLVQRLSRLYG